MIALIYQLVKDTSAKRTESFSDKGNEGKEGETSNGNAVMPTGKVLAVLQRNWRDYVASFAHRDEVSWLKGWVLFS